MSARSVFAAMAWCGLGLLASTPSDAQEKFPGIGRPATPAEIAAWDIDVRADFRGLPKGAGTVARGQQVWEGKCESCHGTFGDSNEVFTPIVGGTTRQDIEKGRVFSLTRPDYPQRTTLMKLSQLSTLWDYVNRAMPWNAPKSLSVEEVYAVVAYILHLGDIVPADFTLSDANIAEVQKRLPNRNGKIVWSPLWNVRGRGDVHNTACMNNCPMEMNVASMLPDHARNAHGNLAEQNRVIGATRGADTTRPAPASPLPGRSVSVVPATTPAAAQTSVAGAAQLFRKHACNACHAVSSKLVGPSMVDVAQRYQGQADAAAYLVRKIREGGSGVWGAVPMPPHAQLSAEDLQALATWSLGGGR